MIPISGAPVSGDHRVQRVSDWLASGLVELTGPAGGTPVIPPGYAATRARRLTEWIQAATSNTGPPVRLDGARLLGERAAMLRLSRQGRSTPGGGGRLLRTADGWAAISCVRPDDGDLLGALMGVSVGGRKGRAPWSEFEAWAAGVPSGEVDSGCALLGIAGGAVTTPRTAEPSRGPAPAADVDLSSLTPRNVEGAVVVDFSALWAGPLCAHLLGLAGARVIKVETDTRPDGARRGHRGFYDLLHAGHESVSVSPEKAADRHFLSALVERADIVIEASRPRALARFGIDARASAGRGTAWISITARGRSVDRIGFGDDVAACAGLLAHDSSGLPVFAGDALADPLTGLTAAVHALSTQAAGKITDLPMYDVVRATLCGTLGTDVPVFRRTAGWAARLEGCDFPVEAPTTVPRPGPRGPAPQRGQHNDSIEQWLGCTTPPLRSHLD